MAAGMDARAVITNKALITAATARTMKLYGQMIPNTKSGGCLIGLPVFLRRAFRISQK